MLSAIAHAEGAYEPEIGRSCKIWDPEPSPENRLYWDGRCVNGFAEGKGLLLRGTQDGHSISRYDGMLKRGKENGFGIRTYANGRIEQGTFEDGQLTSEIAAPPAGSSHVRPSVVTAPSRPIQAGPRLTTRNTDGSGGDESRRPLGSSTALSNDTASGKNDDAPPTMGIDETLAYISQHIEEKIDLYQSTLIATDSRGRQISVDLSDVRSFFLAGNFGVFGWCHDGILCIEDPNNKKWVQYNDFVTVNGRQYQSRVQNALIHLMYLVKKKYAAPPDPFGT